MHKCPVCYEKRELISLPCVHKLCSSCLRGLYRHRTNLDEDGSTWVNCPVCRAELLRIEPGEIGLFFEVDRIVGHVGKGRNIVYWCRWENGDLQPMKLNELRGCAPAMRAYRKLRHRLAQRAYRRRQVSR